jgi:hypothetical protein
MHQSATTISAAIVILFTAASEWARDEFSCRDEKRLTVCEPDDLLARDAMRSYVQVAHSPRRSRAISPTF